MNAVWSAVSKDWKKALSAAFDVFRAFQSTKETELLQGIERISVVATLDSQTTYPFYVLTTGAVRVKATAGNRARASIGLNVRLVEVQVKRRTTASSGTEPGVPFPPVTIIITPGTPGPAMTDATGQFSLPVPIANARASGRLSVCGQPPVPLGNQPVTVTALPQGATSVAEVTGLVVSVPGYKSRSATGMFVLTIGAITQFYLGDLCLEKEGVVVAPPAVVTEQPKADEVAWSAKTPLLWGDFRGLVPAGAAGRPEGAEAVLEMRYEYEHILRYDTLVGKWKARITTVTVENVMDRALSWVDLTRASDALLNHVQRHFDLNEVYRRALEQTLLGLERSGEGREAAGSNLERQVDALWEAIWAVLSTLRDQYDEETDHGRDTSAQAFWDQVIDGWLADPSTAPLP